MATWAEIKATRTKTEHLVARLLREHYPEIAFEQGAQILGYLPDFYFPARRMLLEIDGSIHDDHRGRERDHRKDERLRAAGYSVFRLRNVDIWDHPVEMAHVIGSTLGILREGVNQKRTWNRAYHRRAGRR